MGGRDCAVNGRLGPAGTPIRLRGTGVDKLLRRLNIEGDLSRHSDLDHVANHLLKLAL